MIAGCSGSESTASRYQRIAEERAKRNRLEKEDKAKREAAAKLAEANKPAPAENASEPSEAAAGTEVADSTAKPGTPSTQPATASSTQSVAPTASATAKRITGPGGLITKPESQLAIAQGGSKVAYSGDNKAIGIYDVQSKGLIRKVYNSKIDPFALSFGEKGNQLAVGGLDGSFKVFSIESLDGLDRFQQNRVRRRDEEPPRKAHRHPVTAISLYEAGNLVATGDAKGSVKLWSSDQSEPLQLTGRADGYSDLLSYQDDQALFAASKSGITYWSIANQQVEGSAFTESDLEHAPTVMRPGPKGKGLAVGDQGGNVMLWSPQDGKLEKSVLPAHADAIKSVGFLAGGQSLVTVSVQGEIGMWSLPVESQKAIKTVEGTNWIAAATEAGMVGVPSRNRNLDFYSTSNGSAVRRHTLPKGELTAAVSKADASMVGLGSNEGEIFFQGSDRKTIASLAIDGSLIDLKAIPQNPNQLAFQSSNGSIGVARFPQTAPEPIRSLIATKWCKSPDQSIVLMATGDEIRAVRSSDGSVINQTRCRTGEVSAIGVDKNLALIGTTDGSVMVWAFTANDSMPEVLGDQIHEVAVTSIGMSRLGQLWSFDDNGNSLQTGVGRVASMQNESGSLGFAITDVQATSTGKLAVLGEDGRLRKLNSMGENPVVIDEQAFDRLMAGGDFLIAETAADTDSETFQQVNIYSAEIDPIASLRLPKAATASQAAAIPGQVSWINDRGEGEVLRYGDIALPDVTLPSAPVRTVVTSPEHTLTLVVDKSGQASIFDNDGQIRSISMRGGGNPIALSNQGQLLIASSADVVTVDVSGTDNAPPIMLPEFLAGSMAGAFTSDGKHVVVYLPSGQLFEVPANGQGDFRQISDLTSAAKRIAFVDDDRKLVLLTANGGFQLIDRSNGKRLAAWEKDAVLDFDIQGDTAIFVSKSGVIGSLDVQDGSFDKIGIGIDRLSQIAISVDGSTATVLHGDQEDRKLTSIDMISGTQLGLADRSSGKSVDLVSRASGGLVDFRSDGTSRSLTEIKIQRWVGEDTVPLQLRALASCGNRFAAITQDGSLYRWSPKSSNAPQRVDIVSKCQGLESFENGRCLVLHDSNQLSIIDVAEERSIANQKLRQPIESIIATDREDTVIVRAADGARRVGIVAGTSDPLSDGIAQSISSSTLIDKNSGQDDWMIVSNDGQFQMARRLTESSGDSSFVLNKDSSDHVVHGGSLWSIAGSKVVSRRSDGTIQSEWDSEASRITKFGVDRSGKKLAFADQDGLLHIVATADATGGSSKKVKLPSKQVTSIVWSPDGEKISVTAGQFLTIIDSGKAKLISRQAIGNTGVAIVAWSDSGFLCRTNQSRIFRLSTPDVLWQTDAESSIARCLPSDVDNQLLAITNQGDLNRYDLSSGRLLSQTSVGDGAPVSVAMVPRSGAVVILDDQSKIKLVDDENQIAELPFSTPLGIQSICCTAGDERILGVTPQGKVLSWSLDDIKRPAEIVPCGVACQKLTAIGGQRLIAYNQTNAALGLISSTSTMQQIRPAGTPVNDASTAPDGTFVVLADGSESLRVVQVVEGENRDLIADQTQLNQVQINPTTANIAALGQSTEPAGPRRLVLFETGTGKVIKQIDLPAEPVDLNYSPSGSNLAIALADQSILVYESATGEELETVQADAPVQAVAFNQNATKLLVGLQGGNVTAMPLSALGKTQASENAVVSLSIHGDGEYVLSGSELGQMKLWKRSEMKRPQASFRGLPIPISQSSVSLDGRYVLAVYGDEQNSTYIWDMQAAQKSTDDLEPILIIQSKVSSTAGSFTSDSKYLLLGGSDGLIRAWSIEESREVARFRGHSGPIADIAAMNQPGAFVSGGIDRSVRSWLFPSSLPAPGVEIPQGALANTTTLEDINEPKSLTELAKEDPYDAARQALISGAKTADILDLMNAAADVRDNVKNSISRVMELEKSRRINAKNLSAERRRLSRSQEKMAPSGAARSLSTLADGFSNLAFVGESNFKFDLDRKFRPVRLLFSDRFIYAARPSESARQVIRRRSDDDDKEEVDTGDNGALLSWDFKFSRLQAHAWSIEDLNVDELVTLPNSAGVVTVPQMTLFNQDGSSRLIGQAASWALSNQPLPRPQYLAVGSEGAIRDESDILTIFSVADLSEDQVSPYSQYRSYEGVVTAMAFAHNSPYLAFCVRERAVHRLFIADAATLQLRVLEEFNHAEPWITANEAGGKGTRNSNAASGVNALAFSPDDKTLVAHGQYEKDLHKFSRWDLSWDSGQLIDYQKSRKELESESGPFFEDSGNEPIKFISRALRPDEIDKLDASDPDSAVRRTAGPSPKIVVKTRKGFHVVNLNSGRPERVIPYLTTHYGTPEHVLSDDGRWLLMGDDNGLAFVYDLINGYQYSLTTDTSMESLAADPQARRPEFEPRPAHSGPVIGVAFSAPDPGQDYPAFAATFGEENKIKVWELYPILDSETGLRSRRWAPQIRREVVKKKR